MDRVRDAGARDDRDALALEEALHDQRLALIVPVDLHQRGAVAAVVGTLGEWDHLAHVVPIITYNRPTSRRWVVDKYEYFRGLPEVGIVPRAPHAGPLLRHVYEQEHGRGGFSGKVAHTYHLYPPTHWLAEESRLLDGASFAPQWESPLRPVGGVHHALGMMEPEPSRDVY